LAERKLVEKAKGIVMQQRKLSEDEAYSALRKMAMDQNLALAEVARRVIAVAHLLA
jgi:response regulator NasT